MITAAIKHNSWQENHSSCDRAWQLKRITVIVLCMASTTLSSGTFKMLSLGKLLSIPFGESCKMKITNTGEKISEEVWHMNCSTEGCWEKSLRDYSTTSFSQQWEFLSQASVGSLSACKASQRKSASSKDTLNGSINLQEKLTSKCCCIPTRITNSHFLSSWSKPTYSVRICNKPCKMRNKSTQWYSSKYNNQIQRRLHFFEACIKRLLKSYIHLRMDNLENQ